MISLFPDEKIISESNDKSVVLTSHRICYEYKSWNKSYNQSIMLEHITSCENYSRTRIIFLILGIIVICSPFILIGGFNGHLGSQEVAMFIIVGIVFLLLYWFTRKNIIVIGSPSTKMNIRTTRMKRQKVLDFINLVEQTKHTRISSINSKA